MSRDRLQHVVWAAVIAAMTGMLLWWLAGDLADAGMPAWFRIAACGAVAAFFALRYIGPLAFGTLKPRPPIEAAPPPIWSILSGTLASWCLWALLIGLAAINLSYFSGVGWERINSPQGHWWVLGIIATSGLAGVIGEALWRSAIAKR